MLQTIRSIAKVIDHSLLHPTLTDDELREGCRFAKRVDVAAVSIKPYAVPMAKEILNGSDVAVGSVVGFPHGNSRIEIKVREAETACADGATELDAVVNTGKVLSRDWDYISEEIRRLNEAAVENHAILKVIFENDYLNESPELTSCATCCAEVHKEAIASTF